MISAPGAIAVCDKLDAKTGLVLVDAEINSVSAPGLEMVTSVHVCAPTFVIPQSTSRAEAANIAVFVRLFKPIPYTVIESGELTALPVNVNTPASLPAFGGRNLMESMIDVPGGITVPERCEEKMAFVLATDVKRSVSLPVLKSVTSVHVGVPAGVVPQFTTREEISRIAALANATPIPLATIISGEEGALLKNINCAESIPGDVGRNTIKSTIEAPGAIWETESCDVNSGLELVAAVKRRVSFPAL